MSRLTEDNDSSRKYYICLKCKCSGSTTDKIDKHCPLCGSLEIERVEMKSEE